MVSDIEIEAYDPEEHGFLSGTGRTVWRDILVRAAAEPVVVRNIDRKRLKAIYSSARYWGYQVSVRRTEKGVYVITAKRGMG